MKNEKYIRRCIELAKNGLGTTYPNPMVGSVIVYKDRIIGEGWHQKAGGPHAEVNAINSVKDKSLLSQSTIYVSLEPCSHFGKTPPCADLIVKSRIPNVVIGTVDPNEKVAGKGIKKLVENGIKVTVGILENECLDLNKRFFTFHQKKRPYIILKWAESKDGFLAPEKSTSTIREPIWITNQYSRQLVHKWRSEEQAILVGTQTVLDDNPKLNLRDWSGIQPTRLVIDLNNRIINDSHLLDDSSKTIVFTSQSDRINFKNTTFIIVDRNEPILSQILDHLYSIQIQSIIIEGGAVTLQHFITENLWDEARIFIGASVFNLGTKAPVLSQKNYKVKSIATDELKYIRNHD